MPALAQLFPFLPALILGDAGASGNRSWCLALPRFGGGEFPREPRLVWDGLRLGARAAQDRGRRLIPQFDWQDQAENRSRESREGKCFSSLLDRDAAERARDQRTVQTRN